MARATMGMTPKARKTRELIDDTVKALIVEKGVGNFSIKDIYTRAGIAAGNFYYYYQDLDEAILVMFGKMDERFQATFCVPGKQGSPVALLEQYALLYCEVAVEYGPAFGRQTFKAQLNHYLRISDPNRPLYTILRSLIEGAIASGALRLVESVESMAVLFLGAVKGLCFEWFLRDGNFDLNEEALKVARALLAVWLPAK